MATTPLGDKSLCNSFWEWRSQGGGGDLSLSLSLSFSLYLYKGVIGPSLFLKGGVAPPLCLYVKGGVGPPLSLSLSLSLYKGMEQYN